MNPMKNTVCTQFRVYGLMLALIFSLFACSDDDDGPDPVPEPSDILFFISASGAEAEYILTTDNLEEGVTLAGNGDELELSGYTWTFNDDPSVAIGWIYRQGDPGIGLGYHLNAEGALEKLGEFQVPSRFTSYGFFDHYAVTSVGGQTPVDGNGNALLDDQGNERTDGITFNRIDLESGLSLTQKTITTLNITGNGDQATFSGIVDIGNGEFLTGMVVSQPRDPNATGGSSTGTVTYPDSCWVAVLDGDFNVKRIYRSNKLSYSSGRYRSQYYSQIGRDDDGNVYVFSGSYETSTTRPCGALRINSGANDFDDSYYFNIEELSEGYHFRKVWHITDDYFLLEFYNTTTVGSTTAATQYGIVKMEDKTFSWVGGVFPGKDEITATGLPMTYEGKIYMPITIVNEDPAIYIIDPATATAVKGISISGTTSVNAVGVLMNYE